MNTTKSTNIINANREFFTFSAIHCATMRRMNLPVNMHGLAKALHDAYGLPWGTALEAARGYVDGWLRREDARTHRSEREGVRS